MVAAGGQYPAVGLQPPGIVASDFLRKAARESEARAVVRQASRSDIDRLEAVEGRAFAHNRLNRRRFAHFLRSPSAALVVADRDEPSVGYALVLFRAGSRIARLYSIAVDPLYAKNGVGAALLDAAEDVARGRASNLLRLEAREDNWPAIRLYCKSGYNFFGRHSNYYDDGCNALRLEKRLA